MIIDFSDTFLNELHEGGIDTSHVCSIFICGSICRGTLSANSDIDVVIIADLKRIERETLVSLINIKYNNLVVSLVFFDYRELHRAYVSPDFWSKLCFSRCIYGYEHYRSMRKFCSRAIFQLDECKILQLLRNDRSKFVSQRSAGFNENADRLWLTHHAIPCLTWVSRCKPNWTKIQELNPFTLSIPCRIVELDYKQEIEHRVSQGSDLNQPMIDTTFLMRKIAHYVRNTICELEKETSR